MTNYTNTVLYIGVTNNLQRRVQEHKEKINPCFTARYNCSKLVYYEVTTNIVDAIQREKQLKNWKRERKDALVNEVNPKREDLSASLS
jgi:putative endonuclease